MSCEKYETLIPEYVNGTLMNSKELENHLETCLSCQVKETEVRQAALLFSQWSDEPVPTWNRAPIGFFNQKKTHWFWTWSPLVFASVLMLFVLFNIQITVGENGTTIRFSKSVEQVEVSQEILQLMESRDQQNQQAIKMLLESYQGDQQRDVKMIVEDAMEENQSLFTKNLQQLNANWENQREVDNRYWGKQLHNIYLDTNKNNENLNLLADHINRSANSR